MNWIEKLHKQKEELCRKRVEEFAEVLFNVTVYEHTLWFTYNGSLYAPCSILGCKTAEDAVKAVDTMRAMYIERNTKKNG